MKKTVTAIICALILTLSLAACGATSGGSSGDGGENGNVQIPAPWTDYSSVDEAENDVGFKINAPESIGNYSFDFARAFDDGMLELFYAGENGYGLTVRKAEGSGDISGDYNAYSEIETITVGDVAVTIKGNGEGVCLALWENGGYAYSMSAGGAAVTEAEAIAVVSAVCGAAD